METGLPTHWNASFPSLVSGFANCAPLAAGIVVGGKANEVALRGVRGTPPAATRSTSVAQNLWIATLVASASATGLTRAAVRTFARPPGVLVESSFASGAILDHLSLGQVLTLVRFDSHTRNAERAKTECQGHGQDERRGKSVSAVGCETHHGGSLPRFACSLV